MSDQHVRSYAATDTDRLCFSLQSIPRYHLTSNVGGAVTLGGQSDVAMFARFEIDRQDKVRRESTTFRHILRGENYSETIQKLQANDVHALIGTIPKVMIKQGREVASIIESANTGYLFYWSRDICFGGLAEVGSYFINCLRCVYGHVGISS